MLVVALELRLGGSVEKIQIAFPYAALEALIRHLSQGTNSTAESTPSAAARSIPEMEHLL